RAFRYRNSAGTAIAQAVPMLRLSDRLAAPAHVVRGPYTMKVMRIGKVRDGSKVGVFIFCQQHAREWVTPLTCWETAERLLKNYATDSQTKELVDNLDIFILPSVNPDGSHYSRYDFAAQRRNLINHCAPGTFQDPLARNAWASTSTATTASARSSTATTAPATTARATSTRAPASCRSR